MMKLRSLCLLGPLLLAACSSSDPAADSSDAATTDAQSPQPSDDAGADSSKPPTAAQMAQAQEVRDYVAALEAGTGTTATIDWQKLADDNANAVLTGDGTDKAVYRALLAVQAGVPQGHQTLVFDQCGDAGKMPWAQSTWYGVCGRPYKEGIVVTYTNPASRLGLQKGDVVLGTDRHPRGAGFFDAASHEPVCGSSMPSPAAMRERTAASFFGTLEKGMKLTVRAPGGAERTIDVPDKDDASEWCMVPFGGREDFEFKVTTRPDGIAVVRLPGFLSPENPLPDPLTEDSYNQWVADYVERLRVAFQPIKNAPGIIFDARSNRGGAAEVALAIVAGIRGAVTGVVSKGYERVPDSIPFAYDTEPVDSYSYSLTAGGPLALGTNTATVILTDGLTYSAGDYFVYAAKTQTKTFSVGSPTAGAFGYGGNDVTDVAGPAPFSFAVDGMKATSAAGIPLEGSSAKPDLAVEYDPNDVAKGIDTVLEAAVTMLGSLGGK